MRKSTPPFDRLSSKITVSRFDLALGEIKTNFQPLFQYILTQRILSLDELRKQYFCIGSV
jgi:hypothetical protein